MTNGSSSHFLGPNGVFERQLEGFRVRQAQQVLAEKIEQCIEERCHLVAEAGTGVGKTFAYLVPSFLARKKIIISTGTKNLQDQLYFKDIPIVRQIMALPAKVSLLKGRANYICQYRLDLHHQEIDFQPDGIAKQISRIVDKVPLTRFGEVSEIKGIAEDSPVWPLVTSNTDNCLGQECPAFADCYVVKARRKALAADIVIINHHLLFSDLNLKDEGFGQLLPDADVIIVDEAHQLPEVASHFFGKAFSVRQMINLFKDIAIEQQKDARDIDELLDICQELKQLFQNFRQKMGDNGDKKPWQTLLKNSEVQIALDDITQHFVKLVQILEQAAGRSQGLDHCYQRCQVLYEQYRQLTQDGQATHIHWYELYKYSFTIHQTPIDINAYFQSYMQEMDIPWIFASATLAVDNDFHHFANKLGMSEYEMLYQESPFDFEKQALLYLPRGLPDPNAEDYTQVMVSRLLPILEATQGRTFFLFTSYHALRKAATLLQGLMLEYPILVQGTQSKEKLLQQFRKKGNAILLGTNSFWEGVDVKGQALSCVIIDKFPFASPGDPILQARSAALRKQGKDPFRDEQLPKAILSMKQGIGRLIRDEQDHGLLVICDPRLGSRDYGQRFLNSLPTLPRTRNLSTAIAFIETMLAGCEHA